MPTVILFDVSLSMSQVVTVDKNETIQRRKLAIKGINTFLDHLSARVKSEFVSLVIYSSLWEHICGFTRDYDIIRSALENLDEFNSTCTESGLGSIATVILEEWGSSVPSQVVLITDGNVGIGEGSLQKSLHKYLSKDETTSDTGEDSSTQQFPIPFPCKLYIMCIASRDEPAFQQSLPHYEKLLEVNSGGGEVFVTEGELGTEPIHAMFKKMAAENFNPFEAVLSCGKLECSVSVFPAPEHYDCKHDFEHFDISPSPQLNVHGFIDINDMASPPYLSRHLVLPVNAEDSNLSSAKEGIDKDSSHEAKEAEDAGKVTAFTVLLHGSLKVSGMVAVATLGENWFGVLYSWADSKKKSNLMLSLFQPGSDNFSWLGNLKHMAPTCTYPESLAMDIDTPNTFPIRPVNRRSYTQSCVVWIKHSGLQADIQKILRSARKIPEKQQHFYKEVNRIRKAALSFGFYELMECIAQLLERECTLLPSTASPEVAVQLTHAAKALRSTSTKDISVNILPLKTE